MRKRGAQPKHRAKSMPGLVVQHADIRYELRLRQCVEAFRHGIAQADHHADMADCRDLIVLALESGHCRADDSAHAICDLAGVALSNILDRYTDKRRWGCTGDELQALEVMMDYSLDFWNRRSGALYYDAYRRLKKIRIAQTKRLQEAA